MNNPFYRVTEKTAPFNFHTFDVNHEGLQKAITVAKTLKSDVVCVRSEETEIVWEYSKQVTITYIGTSQFNRARLKAGEEPKRFSFTVPNAAGRNDTYYAEEAFHIFNAPEEVLTEAERKISEEGRKTPLTSLSVGDTVRIEYGGYAREYVCEDMGWREIETKERKIEKVLAEATKEQRDKYAQICARYEKQADEVHIDHLCDKCLMCNFGFIVIGIEQDGYSHS